MASERDYGLVLPDEPAPARVKLPAARPAPASARLTPEQAALLHLQDQIIELRARIDRIEAAAVRGGPERDGPVPVFTSRRRGTVVDFHSRRRVA